MDEIKELYNLLAKIISCVIKNTDNDFYKRYDCRTTERKNKEKDLMIAHVPLLFEDNEQHYRELGAGREGMPEGLLQQIQAFVVICTDQADYGCLLRLIEILDMTLETQMTRELESLSNTFSTECLNANANRLEIGIVPRCVCHWERNHRGSQHLACVDNYLKNILLIDYNALGRLEIVHHYLPVNTFAMAEKRKKLHVAISPLAWEKNFQEKLYEKEEIQYFSLQHIGDVEKENKQIKGIIEAATGLEVDILIFPEACGNTKMMEEISEFLQDPVWIGKNKPPMITVLPSVWNANENTSHVMSHTGDVICSQNKQEAYVEENGDNGCVYEDIERDHIVHLIHGVGIGRMVVMICKDFLTSDYLDLLLKELKVTMILVPSFSSGYHDFKMISGKLLSADCCAVWVNAMAAVVEKKTEEKRLGFIVRSGKNTEENRTEFYIENEDPRDKCVGSSLKTWDMYFNPGISR